MAVKRAKTCPPPTTVRVHIHLSQAPVEVSFVMAQAVSDKVDWVALIDQVWDQENNESLSMSMVPEEHLESTPTPLQSCCTPQNRQMKLCIGKVSLPSDSLCTEDPLKQMSQESEHRGTSIETPKLTQSNKSQTDILWYLDKVYNSCTDMKKTPRKALVNSPLRNIHTPLDNSFTEIGNEARRLFPNSCDRRHSPEQGGTPQASESKHKRKRKRNLSNTFEQQPTKRTKTGKTKKGIKKENDEQLYLDLGQKDFGHVSCPTCGMVYTKGQPEDKMEHLQFHKKFVSGVSFPGWKKERVIQLFSDGRVILVLPSDPKQHLKKIEDIFRIMDIELGYAAGTTPRGDKHKVFLYISAQKRIMGCVVAEEAMEGYQVLTNSECKQDSFDSLSSWFCSTTPQPAELGINRVWVAAPYRRKGVGTRLLDTVRSNFSPGKIISKNMIAFTDPTPDGKAFASKYCETSNFLVYRWV